MSKAEILAAPKSVESSFEREIAAANQRIQELLNSIDSRLSELYPNMQISTEYQGIVTITSPISVLPQFPPPIYPQPHFLPNSEHLLPTSSPPINVIDLQKSQSNGMILEKSPSDMQESHSLPTEISKPNSTLSQPTPQLQNPFSTPTPPQSKFQPPLPQTLPPPIPPQPTDPPPSDVLPLPTTSPPKSEPYSFTKSFPPIFDISPTYVTDLSIASDLQRSLSNGVVSDGSPSDLQKPPSNLQKSPFDPQESRSSLTDIADPNSALSQPTFQSKPIIKESEFLPKSPPSINEINLEKSQFVSSVDSRFSDPHPNSHTPTPLPLEFSSDLHESLLDLKDSRSSPPTNIADSISVLSKPVPQPQKPSTSIPPLPIKRWNPKEIIVKQERWFCYNRDSRRSPLRRSHSRLLGLDDIEEWCKSSSPERVGCALSVSVHPPLRMMFGGEPPPVITASVQSHQIQVMEFLFAVMLCGEPPPVTYFHPFGQRFKSFLISVRFK